MGLKPSKKSRFCLISPRNIFPEVLEIIRMFFVFFYQMWDKTLCCFGKAVVFWRSLDVVLCSFVTSWMSRHCTLWVSILTLDFPSTLCMLELFSSPGLAGRRTTGCTMYFWHCAHWQMTLLQGNGDSEAVHWKANVALLNHILRIRQQCGIFERIQWIEFKEFKDILSSYSVILLTRSNCPELLPNWTEWLLVLLLSETLAAVITSETASRSWC